MTMILKRSNLLLLRVVPVVLALVAVKLGLHFLNWEFLNLNPIFSGIIGADVFLMGFLLSGVLSDFKESEKVPGELAAGLYAISDELVMLRGGLPEAEYHRMRRQLHAWSGRLFGWFHKKAKTGELLQSLQEFNDVLTTLEQRGATPTQLNRIRLELNGLRKFIIRIHTIRETDFISSGYLIVSSTSYLLIAGLIFTRIEPFYESLFFVGVICYLLVFMLRLIKDLDNPFGYYDESSCEDVSLLPLERAIEDLELRDVPVRRAGSDGFPAD